jgi:hypothetical protein
LDNNLDQLDILSYDISRTTLEEVFLRVSNGENIDDHPKVDEENGMEDIKLVPEDDNYCVAD